MLVSQIIRSHGKTPYCYYLSSSDPAFWSELCDEDVPVPEEGAFYVRAFLCDQIDARTIDKMLSKIDSRSVGSRISAEEHRDVIGRLTDHACTDKIVVYLNAFKDSVLSDLQKAFLGCDIPEIERILPARREKDVDAIEVPSDAICVLGILRDADKFMRIVRALDERLDYRAWRKIASLLVRRSDSRPGGAFREALIYAWDRAKPSLRTVARFFQVALLCGGQEQMVEAICRQVQSKGQKIVDHLFGAALEVADREETLELLCRRFYDGDETDAGRTRHASFLLLSLNFQSSRGVGFFLRKMASELETYLPLVRSARFIDSVLEAACVKTKDAPRWTAEEWMSWISGIIQTFEIRHVCMHHRLRIAAYIHEMEWVTVDREDAVEALFETLDAYALEDNHDIWRLPNL